MKVVKQFTNGKRHTVILKIDEDTFAEVVTNIDSENTEESTVELMSASTASWAYGV